MGLIKIIVLVESSWSFQGIKHSGSSYIIEKIDHYGIKGNSNKWFTSDLNRKQFVSINGFNCNLAFLREMPRGSILGPLVSYLYGGCGGMETRGGS